MLTVSKALLMSRDTSTVLCGVLLLLKPCAIVLLIWCGVVVVECFCLNPCWCSDWLMLLVMSVRMVFLFFWLLVRGGILDGMMSLVLDLCSVWEWV